MKLNTLQAMGFTFIIIGFLGYIFSTSVFFIGLYYNNPNLDNLSISTSITSLAFLTLLLIGMLSFLWDIGLNYRLRKGYVWALNILAIFIILIPLSSIVMYFLYSSTWSLLKTYATPLRNIIFPVALLIIGISLLQISQQGNSQQNLP